MYLSLKCTILQMMHVSGHNHKVLAERLLNITNTRQPQKTFMDYIKLSSEEIADEIAAMSKKESDMW